MEREGSVDDSQDEEYIGEEESTIPLNLDDEFFSRISQDMTKISKHLQATGEVEYAIETHKLLLACKRLRRDISAKNHEIENMKFLVEDSQNRLNLAMQMSKVDYAKIVKLKEETENAWRQADAAQAREQLVQEQLFLLRDKLDKMECETVKGEGKKEGGDEIMSSLASHKEGILKERDRLSAEVEELKRRLQIQRLYTDEIEKKRAETEEKNKDLYKLLDDVSGEAHKEKRNIDTMKDKLALLTADRASLAEEVKELKSQNETLVANNIQQNMQIYALKANLDRTNTQMINVNNKLTKFQTESEHVHEIREKLQYEANQKNGLLKLKDEEITKLKADLTKSEKIRDSIIRKLQSTDQARSTLEAELTKIKTCATLKLKQDNANSKILENLEKQLQLVIRERDSVLNEVPRLRKRIMDTEESLLMARHEIRSLKEEMKQKEIVYSKQKALVSKIEVERDRNAEATQILEDKIDSLNEEIRMKEEYIAELKDGANELNASLVKMEALFETARMERNSFESNLQGSIEERNDLKSKLAITNRKIEQFMETLRNKDAELLRQQKNLDKVERELQKSKMDFRNLEVILQNNRSELKEKRVENDRLYKTLSSDELRIEKLHKQYDFVLHEKDLIGSQLIRRNNEVTLLKEKIQVLQAAIDRGEKQYADRMEDIRLLKVEIKNLRSQRNILTRGLANTTDMRHEVLQLHRVLNQERVKSKALEQEMMTPMNVHRWRTLAGKDPDRMELILKIQSLQRRILSQTALATEREEALHESHSLYNTLKDFMLKLPSYKVKERLVETQHALQVRNKKLKALAAELNAKALDEKSKECEVESLRCNLESAKQDLIREKKRKQKLQKECDMVKQMHSYSAPSTCVRMAGAGFRITQSS